MTNGMVEPSGLPSQTGEAWWKRAIGSLQEDPAMWGSILGRGAQVFSARDPQSWQYQLGGLGAEIGQAHKMAMTAEADKKRRDELNRAILRAFGVDLPVSGEEEAKPGGDSLMSLGGMGGMDDRSLIEMFLGR